MAEVGWRRWRGGDGAVFASSSSVRVMERARLRLRLRLRDRGERQLLHLLQLG